MVYLVLGLAAWLAAVPTVFGAEIGRRYAPNIFVGGVVNGASFTPAPNNFVSPNAIISIFGKDLSLTTRQVRQGDLVKGRLPQTLAGVTVSIGGVRAHLFFVSSLQINAQVSLPISPRCFAPRSVSLTSQINAKVPSGLLPTILEVQVKRGNLQSNVEMIEVRDASPGLFSWPSSFIEGPPRAAVTHQDFSPVGRGDPEGATPAHPGELIVLWATGFGCTAPSVIAGVLPTSPAPLILPLKVWLEETLVPDNLIFYAGLAPGLAGLYQINLLLGNDIPTGDVEVVVEVDGVQSQLGMTIPIDPLAEP